MHALQRIVSSHSLSRLMQSYTRGRIGSRGDAVWADNKESRFQVSKWSVFSGQRPVALLNGVGERTFTPMTKRLKKNNTMLKNANTCEDDVGKGTIPGRRSPNCQRLA